MNTYAEHSPENKSHASAHIFDGMQQNNASMQLDNRPATAAQRKLQEAIQNNFPAKQEAPSHLKFSNAAPIQMMRPHIRDIGRDFLFTDHRVAVYLGPVNNDETMYRFRWHGRDITVHEDEIVGYRPTVGRMHPPGQIRPPEENVSGRKQVLLSEGDLSGAMSVQRNDPMMIEDMVVTTFENIPDYPDFEQNAFDLESLGVPILNNFDISNRENSKRLETMGQGGNLHFQMPRVPRSVKGYSTQKLVNDTLSMPKHMERDDLSVSITTPDRGNYKRGVFDRFYGIDNENAISGTGMELEEETNDDFYSEEFGYTHKQSTINKSAKVAEKRKKFNFVSKKTEHEDYHGPFFGRDDEDDEPPLGGQIFRQGLEEIH